MGIMRNFYLYKYNMPVQSEGLVNTVADFVTKNSNAVSSVSGAAGNISDAIKAAKRFNELQLVKLSPKVISELKSVDNSKKGDGYEIFLIFSPHKKTQ